MSDALARVIATALEAGTALNEERVRQLIREELAAWKPATQEHGWMSPPAAAKARGIAVKRVRALMDSGAVQKRAKNPGSANPKFEISLASLDAALRGGAAPAQHAQPIDAAGWAAQRAARKAGA